VASASGGQNLTPYQNVFAPAGFGGDRWGANGGGQVAVGGPLPALANAARAVRQADAVYDAKNNVTVQGGMSRGAVSTQTADQVYADDSSKQIWTADLESPGVADSQL
jgi:hypothetical protein